MNVVFFGAVVRVLLPEALPEPVAEDPDFVMPPVLRLVCMVCSPLLVVLGGTLLPEPEGLGVGVAEGESGVALLGCCKPRSGGKCRCVLYLMMMMIQPAGQPERPVPGATLATTEQRLLKTRTKGRRPDGRLTEEPS